MPQLKHLTIRTVALKKCYDMCLEKDVIFFLTSHFTDRVNLRSPNQDETFLKIARCVRFMLDRADEFSKPLEDGTHGTIGILIGSEHFFFRHDGRQLTGLTYFLNVVRDASFMRACRKFQLKEKVDATTS